MKNFLKKLFSYFHKNNSPFRYFIVEQPDGLEYKIEIYKNVVDSQLEYWYNNNIGFIEISEKEFNK